MAGSFLKSATLRSSASQLAEGRILRGDGAWLKSAAKPPTLPNRFADRFFARSLRAITNVLPPDRISAAIIKPGRAE